MSGAHAGFELVREQSISELDTAARLFLHHRTGAEVLSLSNRDENKSFGVTFRTLPSDDTGVAHILEHSVLSGSRKYPVRELFVELLKGSCATFINAMTFPDKTCYPVASMNLKDFYNLVDVYFDVVFNPLLESHTLDQEGWHFELEGSDAALRYKGVVFNEMKGAYSLQDAHIAEQVTRALLPNTIYANSSGGDPRHIPELSYARWREFHQALQLQRIGGDLLEFLVAEAAADLCKARLLLGLLACQQVGVRRVTNERCVLVSRYCSIICSKYRGFSWRPARTAETSLLPSMQRPHLFLGR